MSHASIQVSDPIDPDLICPLLFDLFEDPVQLPCCGKAVSRLPIIQAVEYSPNCPLCRDEISNTDFTRLPTMRNLVGLVENARNRGVNVQSQESGSILDRIKDLCSGLLVDKGEWKATLKLLRDERSAYRSRIGKLEISNNKVIYKTLVIPVIDRSGSMGGTPMVQVRYSLKRLVDLTYDNPNLITTVVTYDDRVDTYPINTTTPRAHFDGIFSVLDARGGTSFKSAFSGIVNVATTHANASDVASMIIVFLTDGEDSSVRKEERFRLVQSLQEDIRKVWSKDFTIHSIGFGSNHDYDFLNSLRLIGTEEGAYRYADPREDDDILSGKINSVLDVISKSSSIPMKILPESDIQVLNGSNGKFWVTPKPKELDNLNVVFTVDDGPPISIIPKVSESMELWTEWYSKLIDDIASELLILAKDNKSIVPISNGNDADLERELHIELLVRRANSIMGKTRDFIC